ncbi:Ig-like domain repeat protein [Methanobrevibacter sp.]
MRLKKFLVMCSILLIILIGTVYAEDNNLTGETISVDASEDVVRVDSNLNNDSISSLEIDQTQNSKFEESKLSSINDDDLLGDTYGNGGNFRNLRSSISSSDGTLILTNSYSAVNGDWGGNNVPTSGIVINKNIIIRGDGMITLDANSGGRIFSIENGASVTLENLIFTEGSFTASNNQNNVAGAVNIQANSKVTLINCSFYNNKVTTTSNNINIGGAAVYVSPDSQAEFKDCNFTNNYLTQTSGYNTNEMGSAVAAKNNVKFNHCIFKDNYLSNPSYTYYISIFPSVRNPDITSYGALFIDGGGENIEILNCQFSLNTAQSAGTLSSYGMAVSFYGSSNNVKIINSTFSDHSAVNLGGAIYFGGKSSNLNISGSNFTNNNAQLGGAIYFSAANNENLNFYDSTFERNNAQSGGAIYFSPANNGNFNFYDSTFVRNTASIEGGAIYISRGYAISISDSKFNQNTISDNVKEFRNGGAIFIDAAKTISIINSSFDANQVNNPYGDANAGARGGAIYVTGDCVGLEIRGSNFTNNNAIGNVDPTFRTSSGGAIIFMSIINSSNIEDCIFINNYATRNGGAIMFQSDVDKTDVVGCTFTKNNGMYGGAIMFNNGAYNLNINGNTFTENRARGNDGGAIDYFGTSRNITIGSTFIGNLASTHGPAIAFDSPDKLSTDIKFIGSIFKDHTTNEGTVYFVNNPETLIVINTTFENNNVTGATSGAAFYFPTVNTLNVSNSNFIRNNAPTGGVFYINSNSYSKLYFIKSNFTKNRATNTDGGAIYIINDNAENLFIDCNFSSNSANGNGGAVYLNQNHATFNKTYFEDNDAKENGGALYLNSQGSTIADSTFTENTATSNGGAIYINAGRTTIDQSYFIDNVAVNNANTIYVATGSGNIISNSQFTGRKHIYINNGALVNLTENQELSTEDAEYTVYNNGRLALTHNNFYNIIYNNGTIETQTYANITGNTTYDWGNWNFPAYAYVYDDNNNSIISTKFTYTLNGINPTPAEVNLTHNADLSVEYFTYLVNATDNGLLKLKVHTSLINVVLKVGSYTWLQDVIDNLDENTLTLSQNVTFNATYDLHPNNPYVQNGLNFTYGMLYNKNFTLQGNNSYISGDNQARIFIVSVSDILINNITFINGTAEDGGALYITNTNHDIVINNSRFINNKLPAASDNCGGAIFFEYNSRDITIENTLFKGNEASSGGAIQFYADNDKDFTNIRIINSNFTDNCDNYDDTGNWGGSAININRGDNVDIINCNFINNSALDNGAIFFDYGSNINVSNCYFKENKAVHGAAFYFNRGYSNYNIEKSTFISNNAEAGAVYLSAGVPTLNNNEFINNTATTAAGLYINLGIPVVIKNTNFEGNNATQSAAILMQSGQGSKLYNVNFTDNYASNRYVAQITSSGFEIDECTFKNNTVNSDNVVFLDSDGGKVLNSNFIENTAGGQGTLFIANSNNLISNTNFTKNTASAGAALYASKGNTTISNSNFKSNIATTSKGAVIFESDNGMIKDSKFEDNKGIDGAAIHTTADKVTIQGNEFKNNNASNDGGAIYFASQNGIVEECNFTANYAQNDGGAIYVAANNAIVSKSKFINNTAAGNGGAIVIGNSYQQILNSEFESNNAHFGGSVYIKPALSINIENSTFKNSKAYNGGAIYNLGTAGATVHINNDTFIGNIASHNGGAVYYIVNNLGIPGEGKIYRDYDDFDKEAITGNRTSLNMTYGDAIYQNMILNSYFKNNTDYILDVDSYSITGTRGTIIIRKPQDPDAQSISVVINITGKDGFVLNYVIDSTNFDSDFNNFNNNTKTLEIELFDLPLDSWYIVNITFEDKNYMKKGNSTHFLVGTDEEGDFHRLQRLINAAYDTGVLDLATHGNFFFTDRLDSRNNQLDSYHVNITRPITIIGYGTIIDALDNCRIFNITSDNVTLINITFRNGNTTGRWAHDGFNGGAIYWDGSNGEVTGCKFENNFAENGGGVFVDTHSIFGKILNSEFKNNLAVNKGGAIDWNATSGNITDCLFENNEAKYGGAVFRGANSTMGYGYGNKFISNHAEINGGALDWNATGGNVTKCEFYNNTAGEKGGAIFVGAQSDSGRITSSIFIGNSVTDDEGRGGAVDWYASGEIFHSIFEDNHAGFGGAVFIGKNGGNGNITNCTFTLNTANYNGGAIDWNASSGTLSNSTFSFNSAQYGGAVFRGAQAINGAGSNNTFISNYASKNGGAVDWNASSGNVYGSYFYNNTAGQHGGAVYVGVGGNSSHIYNSTFILNSANLTEGRGGAVDWYASSGDIENSYFSDNKAAYGGAVFVGHKTVGGNITNSTFENNYARVNGGAVDWNGTGGDIESSQFINNSARYGGAVFVGANSTESIINNSVFNYNHAINNGGAVDWNASSGKLLNSNFTGNYVEDGSGGAVFVGADGRSGHIINSRFIDNSAIIGRGGAVDWYAQSGDLRDSYFKNNTADNGGAVFVGKQTTNGTITNCEFIENTAVHKGGAVDWNVTAGVMSDCYFEGNNANSGAGLYIGTGSDNTTIRNNTFYKNIAIENGGGIDCNSTRMNITNCVFKENQGKFGAALCREEDATGGFGYNNTFIANHAYVAGAALGWIGSTGISIDYYFFYNNTAGQNGGAIYVGEKSHNCSIFNSVFEGNHVLNLSDGLGGAIDCVAADVNIQSSNFTNNYAYLGGAIFVRIGSGNSQINNSIFTNNRASGRGGAINLRSSAASINNTQFIENTATQSGGALYVGGNQTNYIYNSVFHANKALEENGGAIDWISSTGEIYYSNFTQNTAAYGGALYLGGTADRTIINHVIFSYNTATANGGAIDCNTSQMNLTYTLFDNNQANYGAALCREGYSTGGFGAYNNFTNNYARMGGAALGWLGAKNITINHYIFINNTAEYYGGSIFIDSESTDCKILNSTFENDRVLSGDGGSIHANATGTYIYNSTFTNIHAYDGDGGAIHFDDGADYFNVIDCEFDHCVAHARGGAIEIHASYGNVTNSHIASAFSSETGGSISGNGNHINISNCTIELSTSSGPQDSLGGAHGTGGAIFWRDSVDINILNTTFAHNSANANGGSIYIINCNDSVVSNVSFKSDTAFHSGGSISCMNSDNILIEQVKFSSTTAIESGGAIYLNNTNAVIRDAQFSDTKIAWDYGGAIYVNGNVTIENATFENYVSLKDHGRAIYFDNGVSSLINSTFNGEDPIWINKDANVTVTRNNVDNSVNGNMSYSLYNNGNLWLDKNVFDNVIFNNGTIWSQTYTYMLDNKTWEAKVNDTFTFWANITDDNNNTIISVATLNTTNNLTHQYFNMPYNKITLRVYEPGVFLLTAFDTNLKKNENFTGILKVKIPTRVEIDVNKTADEGEEVVITAKVTSNDGHPSRGNVTFNVNGKIYENIPVINGIANITINNLPEGNYPVTATYHENDYYFKGQNSTSFDIYLRQSWIKIVVENIVYGNRALVNITSNANGTVLISFHGKSERRNLTNGSIVYYLENLTPEQYSIAVVYLGNEYYQYQINQTLFEVYKLNTTISATPTNITFGENEIINVTVHENATGYIKLTILNEEFVASITNGTAIFNITGLTVGPYGPLNVFYRGDDVFNPAETNITFNVGPTDNYNMSVAVDNITYGQAATVRVLLPSIALGNATIYIDGEFKGIVSFTNGVARLENITGLDGGPHEVNVTYNGGPRFAVKDYNGTIFYVLSADWTGKLNVEADIYGKNTTFNVTIPENATRNVTLEVDGINYTIAITNGTGSLTLNNITAGFQTAVAYYPGDHRYIAKNTSAAFYIIQAPSAINITETDGTIIANVTANATGNVTFIVNGKEYTVNLTGDTAVLAGKLTIGNNTVVAIYNGDRNYSSSRTVANFTVNRTTSLVNVTATNASYGNPSQITVYVGENQTGFVRITVKGTDINVTVEIVNGTAKFNASDLNVGEYTVNVTYMGDATFLPNINSTKFNITKANMSAIVTAKNITVLDNTQFIIDNVTSGFKGNVIIEVDGIDSYNNIVKAFIEMGKLQAGNYTAHVKFYNDNNYNNRTYDVNFTVSRINPEITVRINDTTYPNKAVAEVNVTNKANGTVFVTVDGKTFNATMTDGRAFVDITGLAAGVKDAVIKFETNDTYNNNISATARFNIYQADSTVKVTRNGTDLIATVTTNATGMVIFIVNSQIHPAQIINGNATWKNALKIGENHVTVIYNGDINFTASSDIAKFNIDKANSTVNVTATTAVYGNASEITVKVGVNQTGFVRIIVNGTDINVTAEIINGTARFNATGLNVGRYMVNVTYLGDDKYLANTNTTYFNITKANMSAVVTAQNVTVLDNVQVIIDNVTKDFSGNVIITVNGIKYDDVVKALIEIGKYQAGNYTADVTFYDDNNYNNRTYKVNFTVFRVDPTITVNINDTTYPNKAVAEVNVTDMANGTVKVIVDGKEFNATMNNGTALVDLTGLSGGVKEAEIRFITNDTYNNDMNATYKFVVYQANTTVVISNVSATVVATVNATATGKVTFIVNGVNKTVDIQNGVARWENILVIGNNTIVAIYEGDVNFTSARNNTVIGVNKTKSLVNVTVNNTVYGNVVVIVVNVPVNETGFVTILVDGKNYTAPIKDGVATVNVTGLKVDEYTVNVTYLGDETYHISTNSTTFNVTKANMSATVTGLNVTVKDNVKFVIDNVTGDFAGNVTIAVPGLESYDSIVKALVEMGKLNAGNYTADVTFYGDDNYNDRTYKVNFTVFRIAPAITVRVNDTTYPYKAVAEVNVTDMANGTVKVIVDGETFTGEVKDGIAKVNLTGLAAGVKEARIIFTSNDNYTSDMNTTAKFVIKQAETAIIITRSGNNVTATVNTNATGTITFVINGRTNTTSIVDGKATWADALRIGDNYVTAIYSGDVNFTSNVNTAKFEANKTNSTVTVNATNVTYGRASEIVVKVPIAQTGFVRIIVEGTNINVTAEIVNGIARFNATGLDVGVYRVNVTYLGDETYYNATNTTYFNITQATLSVTVIAQNVTVKDNSSFYIFVPEDYAGKVNITVDGDTYTRDVTRFVEIEKLLAGNKNATLVFYNSTKYADKQINVTFVVSRVDPVINVTINDVIYSDSATAIVNVSDNANGTIEIYLGDELIGTNTIENGFTTVDLDRLPGGAKEVTVKFITGDYYNNNATTIATFNVIRANSTIIITQNGKDVIATVTDGATGNVTFYINGVEHTDIPIINGNATLNDVLSIGNNTVVAIYDGDVNYTSSRNNTEFIIEKLNSTVNVTAANVTYANLSEITVYVGENQTGFVRIIVEGTGINVTAEIVKGIAKVNTTKLDYGQYRVNVTYLGDDTYFTSTNYTYFNVTKAILKETVIAQNVTVKDNTSFIVNVEDDFKGLVNITIDGDSYIGEPQTVINMIKLASGTYTANVTFYGDDNYEIKKYNVTFTVARLDSALNVTITDTTYPNNSTATVIVPDHANGTIRITVDGVPFSGTVTDGMAIVNISGLDAGIKDAFIEFFHTDNENLNINATYRFMVYKANSTIDIRVVPEILYVGDSALLDITVSCTGNVTIYVDGVKYIRLLDNNKVNVTVNNLTKGVHTIVVYYPGDVNYNDSSASENFTVSPRPSLVNVTVQNATYNSPVEITVNVPLNQTGYVEILVDGRNYTVKITDGRAKVTLEGLKVNPYDVTVKYLGDEKYAANENSTRFNVLPAMLPAVVTGIDVTVNDNTKFVINVTDDFKGLVNITIDGRTIYSGDVSSLIESVRLPANNYVANVTFYNDSNYNVTSLNVSFTVSRIAPAMEVIIDDATYPFDAVAHVNITNNASGMVYIDVDGHTFNGTAANGFATVYIRDLNAGSKTAKVRFVSGDDYNADLNATAKFTIFKATSSVSLTNTELSVIAYITAPGTVGGYVTFYVNGEYYGRRAVTGGYATLSGLAVGNNSVVAIYEGDINHEGSDSSIYHVVPKVDSAITELNVTNIRVGDIETIGVAVNAEVNGTVIIKVDNISYYVKYINRTVHFNVSGLGEGVHTVNVTYQGNGYYNPSYANATFTVAKIILKVNGTGNETNVNITVTDNSSGNITLTIGGEDYNSTVVNGTGTVEFGDLAPGTYNATITYTDSDGVTSVVDTIVEVPKWDSDVEVVITNPIEGVDTVVTVNVKPQNATGMVLVDVDGKGYYVNLTNGTGNITVSGLEAGNHTVTVTYPGDERYDSETVIKDFVVDEAIDLDVIRDGNDTLVNVTVPGNATAGNVTILIDGIEYNGTVENGSAIINVTGKEPGIYNATVIYVDGNGTQAQFNTTLEVPKWDTQLNATVTETVEGSATTISIKVAPENVTGVVLVDIDGEGYYVNLTNGTAELSVKDLKSGNHTITVTYPGDEKYNSSTITQNFTIKEKLDIKPVTDGNSTLVEVDVPGNETGGNVTIIIDGQNYTGNVTNGTVTINLTNVTPGIHNATIVYVDANGTESRIDTTIAVPKWEADLSVDVTEAVEGADTVIDISVDPASDGIVLVDIDGKGYYVNVTNGTAKFAVNDLPAGNHTAVVKFQENDQYKEVSKTVEFSVKDALGIIPITDGNSTLVEVDVPGNETGGNVTIIIDGQNYTGEVINGSAVVNLTNVTPGIHNATIVYVDANGTESRINTTIAVPKWEVELTANATDVVEGADTTIEVNVSPITDGIVLVDIDGKGYYVNVTNGTAKLTVSGLEAGAHTAVVKFQENDQYKQATKTVDFTVKDALDVKPNNDGNSTIVEVGVPGNETGGNVTIIIDGQNYTGEVIDGKAVVNLTNVTPGIHNATIVYVDANGTESRIDTAIAVPQWSAPISASVDNSTDGMVKVTIDAPEDATGYAIVNVAGKDYGINLTNGEKSVTIPITETGDYTAKVTYLGDDKYASNSTSQNFHATGGNTTEGVSVDVKDAPIGEDIEVIVTVPEGETGNVTVTIDNTTTTVPVTGGENIIKVPGVSEGDHNVTVTYKDDATGKEKTITKTVRVFNSINAEKEMTRGWNSPYDYKAEFLDNSGHVLANTTVQYIINGVTYDVKTDSQGIAYLDADLEVGKYDITIINPVTGAKTNATTTIVKRLVENTDITLDFDTGKFYIVMAIGDDGKPVGEGEVVGFRVNGINYVGITDSNGYAKLQINLNPKTYTLTAQYRAYKTSNKIVVKQTFKLVKKTVTVKKGKKIVLKAKVKLSNGKAVKGKVIKFKFKGKTYKAKTNSKGIAKVTIKKKSVLKKLKKGKKYTFVASYNKNKIKGKVKIKK